MAWIILPAVAALSFFVWGNLGVMLGPVLPQISGELGLSDGQSGLIFLAWSAGFAIGPLGVDRLLRRLALAQLLAGLSAIAALAALLIALAQSLAWLLAAYGLAGLVGGTIFTASHTLYGKAFPERRSAALSFLDLVFSLGNLSAPIVVAGLLALELGWSVPYLLIAAGFAGITALFGAAWALLPAAAQPDSGRPTPPASDGEDRAGLVASLLTVPGALLAVTAFGVGAVEWLTNTWFVSYGEARGLTDADARFAMALFIAGMIAARVIAMALGSRARAWPVVAAMSLAALVGAGAILAGSSQASLVAGGALLGAGIGAVLPVVLGAAMDDAPVDAASRSAILVVSLTLGGQVASVVTGFLSDMFALTAAFRIVGLFLAMMVGGMIAFFAILNRRAASAASAPSHG